MRLDQYWHRRTYSQRVPRFRGHIFHCANISIFNSTNTVLNFRNRKELLSPMNWRFNLLSEVSNSSNHIGLITYLVFGCNRGVGRSSWQRVCVPATYTYGGLTLPGDVATDILQFLYEYDYHFQPNEVAILYYIDGRIKYMLAYVHCQCWHPYPT